MNSVSAAPTTAEPNTIDKTEINLAIAAVGDFACEYSIGRTSFGSTIIPSKERQSFPACRPALAASSMWCGQVHSDDWGGLRLLRCIFPENQQKNRGEDDDDGIIHQVFQR